MAEYPKPYCRYGIYENVEPINKVNRRNDYHWGHEPAYVQNNKTVRNKKRKI